MRSIAAAFALMLAVTGIADAHSWENIPDELWDRDFSHSQRDGHIPLPSTPLERENIGTKRRVADLFDLWTLDPSRRLIRWNSTVVDVTHECKGKIELEFALTQDEWKDQARRMEYHLAVSRLINRIGTTLLSDFGNELPEAERAIVLKALPVLVWQESSWQHYYRHKDWFFVIASGGSYNELEDWGISQVARSKGPASNLLNARFFELKGYCSLSRTLYYGFMEFYLTYREARTQECNGSDVSAKILGAYNMYSSGFSLCHDAFSPDEKFQAYQKRALGGFTKRFTESPWLQFMR